MIRLVRLLLTSNFSLKKESKLQEEAAVNIPAEKRLYLSHHYRASKQTSNSLAQKRKGTLVK